MLHAVFTVFWKMSFTVEYLHNMEKEMKTSTQEILKLAKLSSTDEMKFTSLMKLNKDIIARCLEKCAALFDKNFEMCKSAASEIDRMKTEHIRTQNKIIELQQSQLGSVQETVKTEISSWAKVVEKNCKQTSKLSVKSVEQAVKTVTEEEERAKNFIVHGLKEAEEGETEHLMSKSTQFFVRTGHEEPYPDTIDAYRLGEREPGKTRPVKVTMRNAETVRYLLKRAHRLKQDEEFKNVYLSPDRSKRERAAHNKLVSEMKRLISSDSTKHFFIRDGKINSVDKNTAG